MVDGDGEQGCREMLGCLVTHDALIRLTYPLSISQPHTHITQVAARPMMYLALTYDHRLIDGREAVTFLKSIAAKIEDPRRLLLEL